MRFARSRLAVILLAALALVGTACVDDGELGGPSVGGSYAASVGDVTLTHADLADLVDQWAANTQLVGVVVGVTDVGEPGRRPADLVNFVLSFWLQAEQARAILPQVNPDFDIGTETQAAVEGLGNQFPTFGNYDTDFQREIAEAAAYQSALISLLQQGSSVPVPTVEVNPRYGSTIDAGGGVQVVQPPEGPRQGASVAPLGG